MTHHQHNLCIQKLRFKKRSTSSNGIKRDIFYIYSFWFDLVWFTRNERWAVVLDYKDVAKV